MPDLAGPIGLAILALAAAGALLARASGLDHPLSTLYPLAIDLLAAAAYRAALRLQDAPFHVRRIPLVVTVVFVALSVVGNALHAWAPPGGELDVPRGVAAVTAVPPLSGAVIVHLYVLARRWGRPASSTTPAPATPDQNEKRIEEEAAPAEDLVATGARINRAAVAGAVRAQGRTVSTDVAQALLVRVRAHRANRQLVNA